MGLMSSAHTLGLGLEETALLKLLPFQLSFLSLQIMPATQGLDVYMAVTNHRAGYKIQNVGLCINQISIWTQSWPNDLAGLKIYYPGSMEQM